MAHAKQCIEAGANGITVHPRPDQRHIRPSDVIALSTLIHQLRATTNKALEFNIEGNPFAGPNTSNGYPGLIQLVETVRPDQCTLVPDNDHQLTSDHGFDLTQSGSKLRPIISRLKSFGVRVSLFMDPDPKQIELAAEIGADRIELYTGPYAAAWGTEQLDSLFKQHKRAAIQANELGLGLNAGHDLNLENLPKFSTIPNLLEVSIGHAFTVDAIAIGLDSAVKAYKKILSFDAHQITTNI